MPAGLATSAARVSSESVRAQFWTPSGQAVRRIVVREGQSLWDIATAWGLPVEAIVRANGLANADHIRPGQELLIPAASAPSPPSPAVAKAPANASSTAARAPAKVRTAAKPAKRQAKTTPARSMVVTVREGQTLWSVSAAHRVSVDAIVDANGLRNPNRLRIGQRLVIPGHAVSERTTTVRTGARAARSAFTKAASSTVRIARAFLWPARGLLTSRFGWRRRRHHDGIDIGAPYGTPVYAARSGRVIFAGWYYDYGRAVIIDHGSGLVTVYGHASRLLVNPGQVVERGELIARVGSTGRATGPHLHFEVRVNGKAVNPIKYMD